MTFEATLMLARDLAVRLQAPESIARFAPDRPSSAPAQLNLSVQAATKGQSWPAPAAATSTFWAQLEWKSPSLGTFSVPRGRGGVRVELTGVAPLTMELVLDEADSERGLTSALRLALALLLSLRGDYLLHASAVQFDDQAVLFLGESGAGKTTTARRLGREGALRFSDDLVVVRREADELRAEACCFDRAYTLPGRAASWPLAAAYLVRKGAAESGCAPLASRALTSWASAVFMPPPNPRLAEVFLDGLVQLAHEVPLRTFDAAPTGQLLPALRADLNALRSRLL